MKPSRSIKEHILTHNFIPVNKDYFDAVTLPHLQATQRVCKPTTLHYVLADKKITVHFYGTVVTEMFSLATKHHPEHHETPDLTLYAWDDTSTGITPPAPWDLPGFTNDFTVSEGFFGVYVGGEETLSFYDAHHAVGYLWTHDARILPGWVTSAPFRTIFHWFLSESNIHLMHGAVVGSKDKSILLTAKSGSGKSTTALSCLLAGMDYLADDYVAIHYPDGALLPTAHSLYHSAKITEDAMKFFPDVAARIWNTDFETQSDKREKALFFLMDHFPDQVKRRATLDAIVIPKITSGPTRFVPVSKIQALLAIAPTTLLQLPLAETQKISAFKSIIEKTPCYIIELGPDVRSIPEVINQFLHPS